MVTQSHIAEEADDTRTQVPKTPRNIGKTPILTESSSFVNYLNGFETLGIMNDHVEGFDRGSC